MLQVAGSELQPQACHMGCRVRHSVHCKAQLAEDSRRDWGLKLLALWMQHKSYGCAAGGRL